MARKRSLPPKEGWSVRQRKKGHASTQAFLPIAEIRHDTVIVKNGGLRAVLAVGSMNFSLKSEEEQQAIIVSYQQFLNTLSFPIQIVIRSRKLNIDAYIAHVEELAQKQTNPLIKEQTLDYARFIERLVDVSDIMQKRFYVIVPMDPAAGAVRASFIGKYLGWFSGGEDSSVRALSRHRQFEELATSLRDRVNLVQTGLTNVGILSERLTTAQLIELYYETYNPETSHEQELPHVDQLNVKDYVL
jgi:type IV secretory pathway VirB4 component